MSNPTRIDINLGMPLIMSNLTLRADLRTTMSPAGWIQGSPSTFQEGTKVACHLTEEVMMNHLNGHVAVHMDFDMTSLDDANGGPETALNLAQVDDT